MSHNVQNQSRREFLQKTAAVGAVIALSPWTQWASAQSPSRNRVVIAHGVGVYSLNPYAVTTSPIQGAWGSVMEALIEADYDQRGYRGLLAESWEMKGNKLQFSLRKGIRFHDGTPFTAKDVVASYKRILTDKQSLMAPNLRNIKEMETPNDSTVILTLKKVDATALEDFTNRPIMKQAVAEKMGEADNPPIGTGPFKFVSWDRSGQFVIRRNENYWGEAPKIDEVIYKIIKEDAARIAALEAGQADLISNVPPHEVARLKSNPRLRLQPVQGLRPIFLVLSPAYKPLDNIKVRRAITHAIDRERLIQHVLEGNAYPLSGMIGPQVFGYEPSAKAYPYDPEKAKQLLTEAGFPKGFEIDYYSPTGRYPKDREVAQVIVEQLSKVGIKANLKTPEWSIFNTEYKNGKYPIYLTGRGSLTDADTLFQQYFRTGMTKRVLGYSNPKLDEILDVEQKTFDPKKREKLLWEAHKIILEDAPAVPLWNSMDIYAHRADLVWTAPPDEKVQLRQGYLKAK
ncbi:MAG TPA: ABC transporter substrate-binding protein [Candidatus Binatia bacterium]|nr:ABC transporter substrate-binding protein [Candidatus Binatia bacterium]